MSYEYIDKYDLGNVNTEKLGEELNFAQIFNGYANASKRLGLAMKAIEDSLARPNKFFEIKAEIGKSTNPTGFIKTAVIVYSFDSKRWQLKTTYRKFDEYGIKNLEIVDRVYYVGEDMYNMIECMKMQQLLQAFKHRIYQAELKESYR